MSNSAFTKAQISPFGGIIFQTGDLTSATVLTTGIKAYLQMPYPGIITGWTLFCNPSGSIVIDIWKDTYANYPPTVADTITASAKPTISSAVKATSTSLTGWTTTFSAGDVFGFNIDSISTATWAELTLQITRT